MIRPPPIPPLSPTPPLSRSSADRGGGAGGEEEPRRSRAAIRARVTQALQTHGRLSDTIAWWNGTEFAVLAPATDAVGAEQLARRLSAAIENEPPEPDGAQLPLHRSARSLTD